jgi:carboxyl-terminal processing protease
VLAPRPGLPGSVPPTPPPPPSRRLLTLALLLVGALTATALFATGFTLGERFTASGGGDARLVPFLEAYRRISSQYVGEVDQEALVEGAIEGMFRTLDDPYSSYLPADDYARGLEGIEGEFEGIGAEIAPGSPEGDRCDVAGPDCRMRVVRVIPGSPAEAAGLLAEDEILAVDGRTVEGDDLTDVIRRVRGPQGTEVTLEILRDGRALELRIRRDVIRSEHVRSEVLADGQVAYVSVAGFSTTAAEDLREALLGHLEAGIVRYVLDLRDDPGGYVEAAVEIASQFIASGPVFWEERADGSQVAVHARGGGVATDPGIRVAVLVNGGTASASEIVAGALGDSGRGQLVGERTFGKGTIQEWQQLPGDGGGMRLSVARWLTPDRRSVDGTGLEPDVVVRPGGGDDDAQLAAAIELLVEDEAVGEDVLGDPDGGGQPSPGS